MKLEDYIEKNVADLTSLGIYRPELDGTIRDLARAQLMMDKNDEQWEREGYEMSMAYTNKAGATNERKSQFLQNYLQLNDKIMAWKKELGLTAYSMQKMGTLENKEDDKFDKLFGDS